MKLEDLVRQWAEAERAMVKAAVEGPKTDSPEWPNWRDAVFHDLCVRERAAREALHAWVAANPIEGQRCAHCPSEGPCAVCRRAA